MFLLVTGGSGSGKSAYAENRLLKMEANRRIYLATMQCADKESEKRIERHRQMRAGKGFQTIENPLNLPDLDLGNDKKLYATQSLLLECMSNLVANEMFDPKGAKENTVAVIQQGIQSIRKQCDNLVVVTNEIFSDGIEYDSFTVQYQRVLGEINCWMAAEADEVVEVAAGIPNVLK